VSGGGEYRGCLAWEGLPGVAGGEIEGGRLWTVKVFMDRHRSFA